jgi:DNA sulfur modification protein DndD
MTISSIEIENFLSYYRNNPMEFNSGPTLIIGQNNTGKSKLFDAFNWVLYERAFKTREEEWADTKELKDKLINNLAKTECKNGDFVSCAIRLSFIDESQNKYLLTRNYTIKKLSEWIYDCPKNSELTLSRTDAITQNTSDFYDKEADDELRIIFPENLSRYFLFQGENISQVMSLSNKSAFTKALRDLSRIEVFERAKSYSEKVLKSMKKEFENKADADLALQAKKVELSGEIEKLKDSIQTNNELFDNECKERDIRKDLFEKKNEELRKYEECAKILQEIEFLEKQKEAKNDLRGNLVDNQKRDVFDKWMYAGTDNILMNFLAFYNKSKIENKIPEPIRQEFIKEMLRDHKCKVCGSDALDDSDQYKKIESFINDKSLDKEIELINQLSLVADNMFEKVERISVEINDFYLRLHDVEEQIRTLQNKIKIKEEDLYNVIPADVSEDELKAKNFAILQRDRDNYKNDWERSESKISQSKGKGEFLTKALDDKIKEYDSLISLSSNTREKERYLLAEDISKRTAAFYDHFLNKIISDIEEDANQFFTKMTLKNAALSGKVKVDYDNKEVYTIAEDGGRQFNINQANKVSLQIAFVAAVLSVSNNFWDTHFPFIADAPISALGGNNKITAVDTMIDIFSQSIIILKDDSVTFDADSIKNDLVRDLIRKNDTIKNAYELVMEGDTIDEQHTRIKNLKK